MSDEIDEVIRTIQQRPDYAGSSVSAEDEGFSENPGVSRMCSDSISSGGSVRSDNSKDQGIDFREGALAMRSDDEDSIVSSASFRSDLSKDQGIDFKEKSSFGMWTVAGIAATGAAALAYAGPLAAAAGAVAAVAGAAALKGITDFTRARR